MRIIQIAAETSKEDLAAERQYQSVMAKASERDVKTAVFRVLATIDKETRSAYSRENPIENVDVKTIRTGNENNPVGIEISVSFRKTNIENKQLLSTNLKKYQAASKIAQAVKEITSVSPTVKFYMSGADQPDYHKRIDKRKYPTLTSDLQPGTNITEVYLKSGMFAFVALTDRELKNYSSGGKFTPPSYYDRAEINVGKNKWGQNQYRKMRRSWNTWKETSSGMQAIKVACDSNGSKMPWKNIVVHKLDLNRHGEPSPVDESSAFLLDINGNMISRLDRVNQK